MDDINTRSDLVSWIDTKLAILNGPHPGAFASDYWPRVWEDACGFADALGLSDDVDSIGGPIRQPTYVAEVNGKYDYETPQKAIRDKVSKQLVKLRLLITGDSGLDPVGIEQTSVSVSVTEEAAAIIQFMFEKKPGVLCTLDVLESVVTRPTAAKAVNELIDKKLAHRPEGQKSGAGLTDKGIAFANKICTTP